MDPRWAPPLELLSEFVVTIARDRTILYLNRGLIPEALAVIGRSMDDFVAPTHRADAQRLAEEVFATGEVRRLDIRATASNRLFETTWSPLIEDDQIVAVVCVARDVTAQRRAEEELVRRHGLWQALLHAFPDTVFRMRADGTILDFSGDQNEAVPAEAFLLRKLPEVLPLEVAALLADGVSRAVREGGIITIEYQLEKSGVVRSYEARLVRSGENEALAIVRDRTHERLMELRLLQTDRIASLGALAAGVAHEINNPLTYVIGNLTLAIRELASLQEDQEIARKLHDLYKSLADARAGADRVRFIVSDLNTFTLAPRSDLSVVELRKVLDSAISLAWSEIRHRARLVREYEEVPGVLGNEHRLGQVFLNLLVNAAHAIEEGDAQKNTIVVRTHRENDHVVVSVCDSGRGFDERISARMFDPFFTTKPLGEGTGLGLAICHSIVGSLGGELLAKSDGFGLGATFTVRLPASDQTPEVRTAVPILPAEEEQIRGRILVIDDEPVIATLAQRALADHEVYVVTSGRDALELCRDQTFDLILCDLLMPDLTGMDLYERLKADLQGLDERMVFMTAGAFTTRAQRFLNEVSNPRIEKPFDLDELERFVQRALRDPHSRT